MSIIRWLIVASAVVLTSLLAVFVGMWLALPATRLARPSAPGIDPALAFWGTAAAVACFPVAYWPAIWRITERFPRTWTRLIVSLAAVPLIAAVPTVALMAIFTQTFTHHATASEWLEVYGFHLGFSVLVLPGWAAAERYILKR